MDIFLSSRYSRRNELREVRESLRRSGFGVISSWLDTNWEDKDPAGSSAAPPEQRQTFTIVDLEEAKCCDVLVAFTEEPRSNTRGGRHVEFGAALALGKPVIVVGPAEHIFHYHPKVLRVHFGPGWINTLVTMLNGLKK